MSDRLTRQWLRTWDVRGFFEEQREVGRENYSLQSIAHYANEHEKVKRLLEIGTFGQQDLRLARVLEAITAPVAALHVDPTPRYYSYTGANILDRFVDGGQSDLEAQKLSCAQGLRGLMLELTRFESHSLVGIEPWSQERFDLQRAADRLKSLRGQFSAMDKLAAILRVCRPEPVPELRNASTLEEYCAEETLLTVMVEFTCVPRTCFHDEVLFLRTIAQDELCFMGIYLAVRQAVEAIEKKLFSAAALLIRQGTAFVVMLHESFKVLHTMPAVSFADFRDATGNASAVQSFNYQRLDIELLGVNPGKRAMYERVPHLRSLLQSYSREFVSLRSLLTSIGTAETLTDELVSAGRGLDSHLLSWRALHLHFALRYLPPEALGTGGTSGPSYLQKFARQSLFSDTEPDFELIRDVFGESTEVEEVFRARPGTRIAPPEALWMKSVEGPHK